MTTSEAPQDSTTSISSITSKMEKECNKNNRNEETDENVDEASIFDMQLSKVYYYQHNMTGTISTIPLNARQMCLILSPNTTSSSSTVHPDTLAIGWDAELQTYSAPWLPCRSIPVLREACSKWHYQDASTGEVRGPVTTRVLAAMRFSNKKSSAAADDNYDELVDENTKVWSAEIAAQENNSINEPTAATQWRKIADDQSLRIALHAFSRQNSQPILYSQDNFTRSELFDPNDMVFTSTETSVAGSLNDDISPLDEKQRKINKELNDFLKSTGQDDDEDDPKDDDDDDEWYESDEGTHYIRESQTGEWKKATSLPKSSNVLPNASKTPQPPLLSQLSNTKKRKQQKAKFRAKNAAKWIYVTGLPKDTDEEEVGKHFSRVGIIELDPETQYPKIKLYRHKRDGDQRRVEEPKGDASICYAREESVDLAVRILDEGFFRPTAKSPDGQYPLVVTPAKFEKKGDVMLQGTKPRVAEAKRKVAKLAAMQAIGWDEGDNGRITGGLKGLRIVVLKHMFTLSMLRTNDAVIDQLEKQIRKECSELGSVEKITVFSKNPEGVVLVKFVQPAAATEAVKIYNGKIFNGQKVEATYWDGITDFTVYADTDDTEQRLEEFGQWLENQELPEEFRLRVES